MAEVRWIKITVNMFDDEKIDFIESLPECDAILVIWVKLLALSGKCNTGGFLLLTPTMPYNEEMLAHKFKRPLGTVRFALKTFIELGMVEIGEMGYIISNWEKHQNAEKLESIREYNRLAKKKQRDNQKLLIQGNVKDNQNTNLGQSDECQDTEVERDKEEEEEYTSSTEASSPDYVTLIDYYCEKTGVLVPSSNDIVLAKQLVEKDSIPLDTIRNAIDIKIAEYKPKHKQDKIRCLSYFEGKIRDIWAVEQAKAVKTNAVNQGSDGQLNKDSRIGITFKD